MCGGEPVQWDTQRGRWLAGWFSGGMNCFINGLRAGPPQQVRAGPSKSATRRHSPAQPHRPAARGHGLRALGQVQHHGCVWHFSIQPRGI